MPVSQAQRTLVVAETDPLTVILSCQEGDGSKTRWTLSIAGSDSDMDEAQRARDNIVRSITRN